MPGAVVGAQAEPHVGSEPASRADIVCRCDVASGILPLRKLVFKKRHCDTGAKLDKPVVTPVNRVFYGTVGKLGCVAAFRYDRALLGAGGYCQNCAGRRYKEADGSAVHVKEV